MSNETNDGGATVPSISLLDIARTALQAEAVRRAAEAVVKEWQDGIITTKEGRGCGGLSIACLREALSGYIPDAVTDDMSNIPLSLTPPGGKTGKDT